jgi:hypothetical protein
MFFASDFSWGSSYGPSCICLGQRVLTPSGWEGLGNLIARHRAGHRVEVVITDHITGEKRASPVLLALETVARSTRLTLEDGRSVELTDGHAVPAERPVGDEWGPHGGTLGLRRVNLHPAHVRAYCRARRFKSDEELQDIATTAWQTSGRIIHHEKVEWAANVAEWAQRWAPIAVGDIIDGSPVTAVERLGLQNAARLAAADLGWLSISQRGNSREFRVGQRLHEYEGSWGIAPVRMRDDGDRIEIGELTAALVSPLIWGPTWDYGLVCQLSGTAVDVVHYRREGGPKAYHFVGPVAGALKWSETEAAYRWGYAEPRARRWAGGLRIREDVTDTLRPLARTRRQTGPEATADKARARKAG